MGSPIELQPGQKFRAEEGLVWEIDKLLELASPIPHVKMVGPDDRTTTKIIAAELLRDPRRFRSL